MWSPVTLLLLVGVAVAWSSPHEHAWESDSEYQYLVYSRTVTGLDQLKDQYTGVQLKVVLKIQVKSPEKLYAKLSNPQYAHIHRALLNGPETEISDQMLEYRPIPISGKPFEIRLKHGLIRDLLVNRDVPTWELNILKGFVSQLQVDTQGENAIKSKSVQIPVNEHSSAMFTAIEDSVGGECEVLYDITPLHSSYPEERPDRVPYPHSNDNGRYYDVKKVKNYEKCRQRSVYHYNINDPMKKNPNKQDETISQLSTTNMVISGDLKCFTIQSAVMRNQVSVRPDKSNPLLGTVFSLMKLTLVKIDKPTEPLLERELTNLESTGNLVYAYNNPFSDSENRKQRLPSVSWNSKQVQSSESFSPSFGSSSVESSSSSNEEDDSHNVNIQHEAPLHLAPNVPLLPFFVGYKGKSIPMSNKVDVVEVCYDLISQINRELQVGESKNVLEKYTILKNLLRTMSREQYAELEKRVLRENDSQNKQRCSDCWNILRDVVTQAGTGPALLTIANWLKSGTLEDQEAARVFSQLPKNVREPTAEYIKTFYEIIVDPRVSQQSYVNVSAPIALAEIIRRTYYGQKHYPIYAVGPMIAKDNSDVVDRSISYMAQELIRGYEENNNQKIQTYILALGVTGHPKVIPILEPYLEGAKPASKFQRMFMVASMSILAKLQPRLVGPIFYKLYLDTREDYEIRCMAVYQFITLDPPMITLQRIAKFTNIDKSEQVNSLVRSTLDSIAKTKLPQWRNLANKARIVRSLVNRVSSDSNMLSKGFFEDFIENEIIQRFTLQTVGSGDNIIPVFVRFGINSIFDSPHQRTMVAGYAVSNVNQLLREIYKIGPQLKDEKASEESLQQSSVEKLARVLKIKPELLTKLEGNIFINSIYGFLFYPYDSNTIKRISSMIKDSFWNGNKVESTVFNNYETTLSFPTENGLPSFYTLESPTVIKLHVELKKGEFFSEKKKGRINTLTANSVQKRFGFVTPFEHQNYITGIDDNQMLHLPIEYEVKLNINQGSIALKIPSDLPEPQTDSQLALLHYSTVPFTTRQDILDFRPVSLEKNTRQVLISKKHKSMVQKGMLSFKIEYDNNEIEKKDLEDNVAKLLKLRELNNGQYKNVNVLLNVEQVPRSDIYFNLVYENTEVGANSRDNEPQSQELEAQDLSILNQKPNSADRRNEIKNILSKGLKSGKVYVIDVNYNIPSSQEQQVVSIGMVNSNADRKSKWYIYWNSQLSKREETKYEVCYLQEMQYSMDTPLDFEYTMKNAPKDKFKAQLLYGKSCLKGIKVTGVGNVMRSNRTSQMIENSNIAKQCQQEIQKGNKVTRACQKATEAAQMRDQIELSLIGSDFFWDVINQVTDAVKRFLHPLDASKVRVNVTNEENPEAKGVASVKINLSPYDLVPMVLSRIPQTAVISPHPLVKQWPLMETDAILRNKVEKDSCTLDKNMIVTFDKQVYPVKLGPVKHVLLITYPQWDIDNPKHLIPIPEKQKVAILAEDVDDYSREVTLHLSNQEVKLKKLNNHFEAVVNGEVVKLSKHKNYEKRQNDEISLEIFELPDGSIKVMSEIYGISITYDGQRVQILATDKYRNVIRGLCGNYDFDPYTDYLTPNNCLLLKADEFAATYALVQEDSKGPVVENKRKAEQAVCRELSSLSGRDYERNLISDREAGRLLSEGENWGYHQENRKKEHGQNWSRKHNPKVDGGKDGDSSDGRCDPDQNNIVYRTKVFEENNEICFTTRPVQVCRKGCIPIEREPKVLDLYCQPKNEESIAMKRRVEKGANPDFTRKPVSKSHVFQVPSVCD